MSNQPTPDQLNALLKIAGEKLGMDPEELRKKAVSGNISDLKGVLNKADPKKINQVLNNPDLAAELLKSPQAQSLLKKFLEKQ